MSASTSKIDMDALRAAVRKVFAFKPHPKSVQKKQRAQREADESPSENKQLDSTRPSTP